MSITVEPSTNNFSLSEIDAFAQIFKNIRNCLRQQPWKILLTPLAR